MPLLLPVLVQALACQVPRLGAQLHPLPLPLLLPRSMSRRLLVQVLVQAMACQVPRLRVLPPLALKVRLLQSRNCLVGAGRYSA